MIHQPASIVGNWNIEQMDSAYITSAMNPSFYTLGSITIEGSFSFFADSTGSCQSDDNSFLNSLNSFNWSHDRLWGRIYFELDNDETVAIVKYLGMDTLELYVRDHLAPSIIGGAHYYYFKLNK